MGLRAIVEESLARGVFGSSPGSTSRCILQHIKHFVQYSNAPRCLPGLPGCWPCWLLPLLAPDPAGPWPCLQNIVYPPSHKIRLGTNCETSRVYTGKFTVTRHENRSCKYMEDMYCDSDYNNVILFVVINTFYTCQAGVKIKMTVGMFLCFTQKGEMCTVGTST